MKVEWSGNQFVCRCSFEERDLPKQAGFLWNPVSKLWWTSRLEVAAKLTRYFDESARRVFLDRSVEYKPWVGGILFPAHQKLDAYQIEAVTYALERTRSYLALEQGLGKTPIAITVINAIAQSHFYRKVLIIVPPFLITNWKRELGEWLTPKSLDKFLVGELTAKKDAVNFKNMSQIFLVSDSMLQKQKFLDLISELDFDLLIVDEAHRFNNFEAKRTRLLYQLVTPKAEKILFLSGTPMRNRPVELWPVLSSVAHNIIGFMDYFSFVRRYCDARYIQVGKTKKILDVSGSTNAEELSSRLRDFMLVKKFDDHVELKGKEERVVILDTDNTKRIKSLETTILKKRSIEDLVGESTIGELATYRKEIAKLKAPLVHEYVENSFDRQRPIIVFAYHHDLIFELVGSIEGSRAIFGRTPISERDNILRDFSDGKFKILIAQIQTMVGVNITVASHGIFAESSWTPGDNDQAVSRMYRRGQTKKVLIDHLVLADTLDEYVLRKVLEKSKTINKTIKG